MIRNTVHVGKCVIFAVGKNGVGERGRYLIYICHVFKAFDLDITMLLSLQLVIHALWFMAVNNIYSVAEKV